MRNPMRVFEIGVSVSNVKLLPKTFSFLFSSLCSTEFISGMELALVLFLFCVISSGVFSTILLKEKLVKSGNMNNNGFSKNLSRNFLNPKMLILTIKI